MSLRSLKFKSVYRSETDNLLEDFYIPALRSSIRYDRAVGFFSAAMLSYAAQGISGLVENGGTMRLIIGGELDANDAEAIKSGYDNRELSEKFGVQMLQVIDNIADALCYRRLETLAWMIAMGTLEVKIALRRRGIYHEKIGILADSQDDQIVFEGSANETASALLPDFNFESLNVFPGWKGEFKPYFEPYVSGFGRLWDNRSTGTVVISFPEAARQRLIQIAKNVKPLKSDVEVDIWREICNTNLVSSSISEPKIPLSIDGTEFRLFDHQTQALSAWKSRNWSGILSLATGTGKTITALYATTRLFQSLKKLFVVIAVPYQALADQWIVEARKFGIEPIPCYFNTAEWKDTLVRYVQLYNVHAMKFVCVVVVNRTLQSAEFQSAIANVSGNQFLFVGDECHHLRAPKLAASLPPQAELRLGLSATPLSLYCDSSADPLVKYFGPIAFEYGLAEALDARILAPYYYYPHFVELTTKEAEQYEELSVQISVLLGASNGAPIGEYDDKVKYLLLKRARLLGTAENKLALLRTVLTGKRREPFTLFYCGDGTVEDEETGESIRQVRAVSKMIHDLGWSSSEFTSQETRQVRKVILEDFKLALIDAMVAIRCLDEGIDVPSCRNAFILASSRAPRQSIQRRGRILRKSPGKEFAVIHDFPVVIPYGLCERLEFERQLFKYELERIAEFARLSRNPQDSYRAAEPLLKMYNLEHVLV